VPRSARANAAVRDATRQRLLSAAMAEFAHAGFDGTSVRAIASRAKVATGLLYRHFDGKDALLDALFAESMAQVHQSFAEGPLAVHSDDPLKALLTAALRLVHQHEGFWRLSYGLRMQPSIARRLGPRLKGWTDEIHGTLAAMLELYGSKNPAIEARVLFATIDGLCQRALLEGDAYPQAEVIAAVCARYPRGPRR
jgi:AcrR family transcriptional regulator